MSNYNSVIKLIENRTMTGRATLPDHIIRELRIKDSELKNTLKDAYLKRKIKLTPNGWVSS